MPILGSLLIALFSNFVNIFLKWFALKASVSLAAVATLGLLVGTMLGAMRIAIASVAPVISESNFGLGIAIAVPPNASLCLTLIFTTWTATTLYIWQKKSLDLWK